MPGGPCLEPWDASPLSCWLRTVSPSRSQSGSRLVPRSLTRTVSYCTALLANFVMHPEQSSRRDFLDVCLLDIATSGLGTDGANHTGTGGAMFVAAPFPHHAPRTLYFGLQTSLQLCSALEHLQLLEYICNCIVGTTTPMLRAGSQQ